jgi:hypothetical protein
MGNPTLPSALRGFTSEFGKGSGGSLLLWSPAQLVSNEWGCFFMRGICILNSLDTEIDSNYKEIKLL